MNDQTFEILRKIRSHLWDAEYEMTVNRDDLNSRDLHVSPSINFGDQILGL